jgi:hypothetical protein
MRAWYGALRDWIVASRRNTIVVGGVVLTVVAGTLGAIFGLAVATFAVVVYTAVFAAVTMLDVRPLRALPAFEVGLWVDGELRTSFTHSTDRPRAPIDIDACVQNDTKAIQQEIPPPPLPQPAWLASSLGYAGTLDFRETRDEAVERLQGELQTYIAELHKWLEAFDSRRRFAHQLIRRPVAIHNSGETAAEGVTLRLHLLDGLIPITPERMEKLNIGPPPDRPKYEQRSTIGLSDADIARALAVTRPSRPDFPQPVSALRPTLVWTQEQSHDVAEVRLPALTHGLTESTTEPLEILAREPGTYEIAWDAHVANLPRPARGTITIVVAPMPEDGEPLTRVELVALSGDVEIEGVSPARP